MASKSSLVLKYAVFFQISPAPPPLRNFPYFFMIASPNTFCEIYIYDIAKAELLLLVVQSNYCLQNFIYDIAKAEPWYVVV